MSSDLNSDVQHGFGRVQLSIKNGRRASSSDVYLKPASRRSNLHIVPNAYVTKINLNEERRAVGVDYSFDGKMRRVLVNYEIVVSAGTVESPHLLMLSGIGPKEVLEKHGIPVVQDLPSVGQHLQDHVLVNLQYKINTSAGIDLSYESSTLGALKGAYDYFVKGSGTLSWPLTELTGFLKSEDSPDEQEFPDMQMFFFPVDTLWEGYFAYLVNLKKEAAVANTAKLKGKPGITVAVSLLHPKSEGEIGLKSSDPFDKPEIDPKYLSEKRDVEVIVEGLKVLRDILGNEAMGGHKPESAEEAVPGCEKETLWSDDYLHCLVQHRTLTMYHPVGTCRMGKEPSRSVVDSKLRVHGVRGLRVVDASVFPSHVSGNPNIPVVMVAERAADLIKDDVFLFR